MISFDDIRPHLKKFVQEGCETADYIMRVSKTPKDGIYAYEELGEIVRCRDCEHARHYRPYLCEGKRSTIEEWYCEWHSNQEGASEIEPDGFCAWGMRKEARDD